jgi:hypothetical protein
MTPQERYLLHAEHLALIEAARTSPAVTAMAGIAIDGASPPLSAHSALVVAWLISRGEPLPRLQGGMLELVR